MQIIIDTMLHLLGLLGTLISRERRYKHAFLCVPVQDMESLGTFSPSKGLVLSDFSRISHCFLL